MAANVSGEYRVFKYYEGLCSASDFPKELAKVLSLGVRSKDVKDSDGITLQQSQILKAKNWDIVYPLPDQNISYEVDGKELMLSYEYRDDGILDVDFTNDPTRTLDINEYRAKILNQVDKITDTVILKTTTTAKEIEEEDIDDLSVDAESKTEKITMYLEIYKPTYLADPEEYPLDCERQDVIPYLRTKDIHAESLAIIESREDAIYKDSSICEVSHPVSQTGGDIENMTTSEAQTLLDRIITITNSTTLMLPLEVGTSITIDLSNYLTKIKQEDAVLYEFICSNLDAGAGIEAKDYSLLTTLTFMIRMDNTNSYRIQLSASKILTIYEIGKGKDYTITIKAESDAIYPEEELIPEFYLNGIYIPLSPSKYTVTNSNRTITFTDDISFEEHENGVLVVRYSFQKRDIDGVITHRDTIPNCHYVLMRLFDNLNAEHNGPVENITNLDGEITKMNSHISPWSKLSWYRDFEEIFVDDIDADSPTNQISDGTLLVPLETPGLSGDTKLRYWINTNNDRFSLIVMGNASLDYKEERHLIGACYCGRIDSFEGSVNDTSGNFALFTSSSTEPSSTNLNVEHIYVDISRYVLTNAQVATIAQNPEKLAEVRKVIDTCLTNNTAYITEGTGLDTYTIKMVDTKNNNCYYNQSTWPRFMVLTKDSDGEWIPVTGIMQVDGRNFYGIKGKMDSMEFRLAKLNEEMDEEAWRATYQEWTVEDGYYVMALYGSYTERNVITSGTHRDIFGNVTQVDKNQDFGLNTSDGTTSVSMYHTRSKAYYQKHQMLFATTEEYMSKVMYGKSQYTGEYYADRIKITHGNDGPRGTLSDLLVIDSASLYPMDELIINKDFERDPNEYEETFVFFPITAPYSPLSDSPNSLYGLAIKKEEIEPEYEDFEKILKIAQNQVDVLSYNWLNQTTNFFPVAETDNNCDVYWEVLDGTNKIGTALNKEKTQWFLNEGEKDYSDNYCSVTLAVRNTAEFKGDANTPLTIITPENYEGTGLAMAPSGSGKSNEKIGTFKINNFSFNNYVDESDVYYGYGIAESIPNTQILKGDPLQIILTDNCNAPNGSISYENERFIYNVNGIPYRASLGTSLPANGEYTNIYDVSPDKYFVLYAYGDEVNAKTDEAVSDPEPGSINKYPIYGIAYFPLDGTKWEDGQHNPYPKNGILQYPVNVMISTSKGKGNYMYNNRVSSYYSLQGQEYGKTIRFGIVCADGYDIDKEVINGETYYKIDLYNTDTITSDNIMGDMIEGFQDGTIKESNTFIDDLIWVEEGGGASSYYINYKAKYNIRISVNFKKQTNTP